MSQHSILLLTKDRHLKALVRGIVSEFDLKTILASKISDALQLVCRHSGNLELAVIEFADGCHGMTLLHAIDMCQPHLPIIVITANHHYDAIALFCAKELAACLTKPVRRAELQIAVGEVLETNLHLGAA